MIPEHDYEAAAEWYEGALKHANAIVVPSYFEEEHNQSIKNIEAAISALKFMNTSIHDLDSALADRVRLDALEEAAKLAESQKVEDDASHPLLFHVIAFAESIANDVAHKIRELKGKK